LVAITISVSDTDDYIMTTAKITDRCRLEKGVCDTENGVLIWSPGDVKVCRLKEGQTTSCLFTADRISCPSIEMVITKITTINVCGLRLGRSVQGILFSQFNQSVNNEIALTSEYKIKIHEKIRLRREMGIEEMNASASGLNPIQNDDKPPLPELMPTSQINAKLLFLYDTVNNNYQAGIQTIHSQVCKAHQYHLQLLTLMAAGGQPSVLVRTLMRSPGYRATLNGDLLEIYKCHEITDYMLLPQTDCTLEWPIEFYSEMERKTGYLTGITHEIMDTPTPVQCPAPNYYFQYGNSTVHLTNRSIIESFPILPSAYDENSINNMPELSFDSPGVYSVEEISGTDTIVGLLKEVNRNSRIDSIIQSHTRGDHLTPEQKHSMQVLREFLIAPFQNSLATISLVAILLIMISFVIRFFYRKKHLIFKRLKDTRRRNYFQGNNLDEEADYVSLDTFEPVEPVKAMSIKKVKRLVRFRGPFPKPRPKSTARNMTSKSVQTECDSYYS
jgi:hypothetical protein